VIGKDRGVWGVKLAFRDDHLRDVCSSREALGRLWGPAWNQVDVCLTLLHAAARLADLRTFACLHVGLAGDDAVSAVADGGTLSVSHAEAHMTLRPIDAQGRSLFASPGGDIRTLDHVDCVRVLDVSCQGHHAHRQEAS